MVDGPVTLAGGVLQVYGIEHLKMPPLVLDEARFLQLPGNKRDATPVYAQHLGQELLRQRQRVTLQGGSAAGKKISKSRDYAS
jgi:hypothetical protein